MDLKKLKNVDDIISTLRGEKGCPWDRKQTPRNIAVYLIEEAHELMAAIESGDPAAVCEELGDVLFQVLFIGRMYQEQGLFDMESAASAIAEKMIRRHPHVFGDSFLETADQVRQQWHEIKMAEKKNTRASSLLDAVPDSLPALMRAYRISERAVRAGFDWDNILGVMEKVEEEWDEFKAEIGGTGDDTGSKDKVSDEFGDILFTLVNVARFARIHPETALAGSTQKFEQRFRRMEQAALSTGRTLDQVPRDEMERLWDEAKQYIDRTQK
jgi:MazG family protein